MLHTLKWVSDIWTSLDFEWSKRSWVKNGLDLEWDLKFGSPTTIYFLGKLHHCPPFFIRHIAMLTFLLILELFWTYFKTHLSPSVGSILEDRYSLDFKCYIQNGCQKQHLGHLWMVLECDLKTNLLSTILNPDTSGFQIPNVVY